MRPERKKIVWLSANRFGFDVLRHVTQHVPEVEVIRVVTLSEDSKTRMYDGIPTEEWNLIQIPVSQIKASDELELLVQELHPDFLVMCGWRQMVPETALSIPTGGVIGFHPTLLPKGRGPAPIINSILEGVRDSGVTMFYVSSELDAGDIVGQEPFVIEAHHPASVVYQSATDAAKRLIERVFPQLVRGTAPRIPQKAEEATYFPKRTVRDNEILSTDDLETVRRKILAFNRPYAGAFVRVGEKKLVILNGDIIND